MSLRFLYDLDRSSAQFPDQLDQFFHDEKHVECIQNLPEGELEGFLKYLDEVLEQFNHTGQPFRKCFQVLQKVCGLRSTLPLSYQVSGAFSSMSQLPVAYGGFCDVFKGRIDTGAHICVKRIRVCSADNIDKLKKSFCREAAVWKHLSHSNVVSFLGVTLEPLQLVSEWIPGGELREHVRKNPKANRLNLLLGIAEGLAYLHSCNVIHGDLKGPNIMVDESGHPRITDFGLATIARNPHSHMSTLDGDGHTARWCAPELLISEQPADKRSDIFSFGMVIIEVFTGKAPFGECRTPVVIASITTGKIPDRPDHPTFTNFLWRLTKRCLTPGPSDRPDAEEVLATLKSSLPIPPPVRQRRDAGAKPPGGGLAEMCHVREKFDNESVCASDDTQSTKPKGRSIVVRCPVRSFYSPPHHHKWSTSGEKVPLAWHESDNSETVSVQTQPRPNMKKRGLWCRFKRFICCGQ